MDEMMSLPTPYYQDDWATIYLGDCREVLPEFSKDSVEVIFTDPPYGVNLGKSKRSTKSTPNRDTGNYGYDDTQHNLLSMMLTVFPELIRIASCVILTPGIVNLFSYPKPTWTGAIYYPSGAARGPWGFTCWQPILYYGKSRYAGQGSRPDSISSTEAAEVNGHPCPKPIVAWKKLLSYNSLPTDTILDPFMGSGTTLRAAKDLNRKSIGIEISEKYCEIAARRLQQEVFDFSGRNADLS